MQKWREEPEGENHRVSEKARAFGDLCALLQRAHLHLAPKHIAAVAPKSNALLGRSISQQMKAN